MAVSSPMISTAGHWGTGRRDRVIASAAPPDGERRSADAIGEAVERMGSQRTRPRATGESPRLRRAGRCRRHFSLDKRRRRSISPPSRSCSGSRRRCERVGLFAFSGFSAGPASTGRRGRFNRSARLWPSAPPTWSMSHGSYRRRQYPDQQARHHRASVYPRHRRRRRPKRSARRCTFPPSAASSQLTRRRSAADPRNDRPRLYGRGRPSPRSGDQHQAPDGPRRLSRPAPSQAVPVRGQRTHTNARTRKGKAKAIAGKKK